VLLNLSSIKPTTGKKVKYVFGNTTTQREKKLNPHANTPAAVKMNEINPKYENIRKIHRLLANQRISLVYSHVPQTAKFIRNT
jgi:hypothetical protein